MKKGLIFIFLLLFSTSFAQRVLFGDDMTNFPGSWTLGGTSGNYWSQKSNRWYSHSYSIKSTPYDNYNNNVDVWLMRTISLTSYNLGVLTFWVWQKTEGNDYCQFQYSTDGGTSWTTAWQRAGNYPSWQIITITNIPNSANRIRFRFYSDGSGTDEGVYIDDVILYGVNRTTNRLFLENGNYFPENWQLGGNYNWTKVTYRYRSTPNSVKCSPIDGYGYYNYQDNWIDRYFNLTNYDYGLLQFWMYYDTQSPQDYLTIQYRSGGNWYTLATFSGYASWTNYSYTIPNNADGLRFRFQSDGSTTYDGVYIDDITLDGISTPWIDMTTLSLNSPPSLVEFGDTVSVSATIANFSPYVIGTPVYYRIGDFYNALLIVDPLNPYTNQQVNFPDWIVTQSPETYLKRCSTAYYRDSVINNNAQTGLVTITMGNLDVGVIQIISPTGTIDSGQTVNPSAKVKNFGEGTIDFSVKFTIGTYSSIKSVEDLTPNEERVIQFDPWTAQQRGSIAAKCSTQLEGDINPGNNKQETSIFVRVLDVGTIEILSPTGTIDSGIVITPSAKVKNFGNTTVDFNTKFTIGSYSNIQPVEDLAPNEERIIEFTPWIGPRGNYTTKCSTQLTNDIHPNNDKQTGTFSIRVRDCGVVEFVIPYDNIPAGEYNPKVKFTNFGTEIANFTAKIIIGDYVGNTTINNLYPGITVSPSFGPVWNATPGNYTAICSLFYAGDLVPNNNVLTLNFKVKPLYVGWVRMADLTGSKPVKSGGCITALDTSIYGLVGNNTLDLLRYSIEGNSWEKVSDVPSGPKGKKIKKGACITNDGEYVYVIKGNNTKEFYRYHPEDGKWDTLPEPNFTKGIKGGFITKLNNYLYLGSGSNNNEWQRFNLTNLQWENCEPATLPAEKFKIGSAITSYEDTVLYLLRVGGKTNEFYYLNFHNSPLTWEKKNDLPLAGREGKKKKVKEGGSLIYADVDRKLYALKGGNTYEFWQYKPTNDSWYQKEDVGQPNGTPAKKIKGGGSLTYSSYVDFIYCTIGNNTNEFWAYTGPFINIVSSSQVKNLAFFSETLIKSGSKDGLISYHLPMKELVNLRVYNIIGEMVHCGVVRNGSYTLKNLSPGIYFLNFEAKGRRVVKKILVLE